VPETALSRGREKYNVTVLRPLGDPAKDVFKSTRTIPVKVSVADCDGSQPDDLEIRIRLVKTSGAPPLQEINEPVSTSSADRTFMRFVDGQYVYNLAGKALPDPSGTYRIEMTPPTARSCPLRSREALATWQTQLPETPGSRSP
jgi:hypothetical protein